MTARERRPGFLETSALLVHLMSSAFATALIAIGRVGRIALIVLILVLALWGARTIAVDIDSMLRV